MDGYQVAMTVAIMVQDKLLSEAVAESRSINDPIVKKLQCSVDSAMCEIARDFPWRRTMKRTATNGVITFPSDEDIAGVYRVMRDGKAVPFTFDSLGIYVERDGEYEIVYSRCEGGGMPYADIDVPTYVSVEMLSLLISRNYCLLSGRVDEADIFGNRYDEYAEKIRLRRRAHIPPRVFV